MELKEVLLIEDNQNTASDVEKSLKEKEIILYIAKNDDEMVEHFNENPGIQIVILDWLLEGNRSTIARLCLQKLRDNWFVPVVIWSEEISKFEEESDEVQKIFPSSCLKEYSKSEVLAGDLVEILQTWQSTPPMSIFSSFKESATRAIDQSFYNLADLSADDIVRGLKSVIATEEGQSDIDLEHPIDVFTRMISREIYRDDQFVSQLIDFIRTLDFDDEPKSKAEKKIKSQILNHHMYYSPRPEDTRIRTGDIVDIMFKGRDDLQRAVVITPACDLAIAGKTHYLRLISVDRVTEADDLSRKDQWQLWDEGVQYITKFHKIVILRNDSYQDEGIRQTVMSYSHEFRTVGDIPVKIVRLKRLEDPYRSDLIQNFVSHAGRIGIPSFDAFS